MAAAGPTYYCHKCEAHIGQVAVRMSSSISQWIQSFVSEFRMSAMSWKFHRRSRTSTSTTVRDIDFFSIHSTKFLENSRQPRANPRRPHGGPFQFHGATPFGNTTIIIGGGPSANDGSQMPGNGDLSNFLQTLLTQLTGVGVGGGPFPLYEISLFIDSN